MIAGVVLAAGRGDRFGSDKLLSRLGGSPLICRTVANCAESALDRILVVVGEPGGGVEAAIRSAFGTEPRVRVVHNPLASRGHVTSVQAGLRVLADDARAAVIFLGDMPLVGGNIIDRLLDAHRRTGGFVVPVCENAWRHPRVIPARRFGDFLSLGPGENGAVVFERYRDEVSTVAFRAARSFLDVDTPQDLAIAERSRPSPKPRPSRTDRSRR